MNLAVFASGRGSNFLAIARLLLESQRHGLSCLICDRKDAPVLERARELGVPAHAVSYRGRERETAEREMIRILGKYRVDLIALAGYMKLFTPYFLHAFRGPILNLHPALLPKYPGAHGIEESYESEDAELGITVMEIDEGTDTGPILLQKSFRRTGDESIGTIEERIHALEHEWYPRAVLDRLDALGEGRPS
jgi:phosphoribosylglycinamide formyltransferase 1